MKKKYLISFFVIAFGLCVNAFVINKVYGITTDTAGPAIHSISMTNHNFKPGDKVEFDLDIEDDISGINYVYFGYDQTEGLNTLNLRVTHYTGNKWSMTIPTNTASGTYKLNSISASDLAGNSSLAGPYNIRTNADFYLIEMDMDLIVGDTGNDINPPVVSEVIFEKTDLAPGETTTLKAKITDTTGGVRSAELTLREVGTDLGISRYKLSYDKSTGYYTTIYTAGNYKKSYALYDVTAYDNNGNRSIYYPPASGSSNCIEEFFQICTLKDITISILTDNVDEVAPTVEQIYFSKKSVSAPSTIKVYMRAVDSVSGISNKASLVVGRLLEDGTFASNSSLGAFLSDNLTLNPNTGIYEGTFNIDQYNDLGKYVISYITLEDKAGNEVTIRTADLPEPQASFDIVESLHINLTTSTQTRDVVKQIQATENSATIMIDSSNNSTVSKDIFEAIKGTERVIYIETSGIQWVFNGKDITNTKDIDVTTTIRMISQEDKYNISGILDKAVVVSFAENGELPGKALVRLKADYAFRNYIGIDDLSVYYYDVEAKTFREVKLSTTMTDDGYYEFYINHNSSYIISNSKPDDRYVSSDKSDLALNTKNGITKSELKPANYNSTIAQDLPYIFAIIALVAVCTTVIFIKTRITKKITTASNSISIGAKKPSDENSPTNDAPTINSINKSL